jgi:hypothetical protein
VSRGEAESLQGKSSKEKHIPYFKFLDALRDAVNHSLSNMAPPCCLFPPRLVDESQKKECGLLAGFTVETLSCLAFRFGNESLTKETPREEKKKFHFIRV